MNGDCRIDLLDYAALHDGLSGPQLCAPTGCDIFDWDNDCDVDMEDSTAFVSAFTGPEGGVPGCDR